MVELTPTMGPRPRKGNLPADISSFVGRHDELAETKRLLSAARLVTLTGVGGVGKTRLALRLGRDVQRSFPDGVWLVRLATLNDPGLLAQTVEEVLGIQAPSSTGSTDVLVGYLRHKQLLFVLDNCEHLVDSCAVLADRVLAAAAGVRVLATSRQSLGVGGEHLLAVPPLPVPHSATFPALGGPNRYQAVRLFEERATAVAPWFAVTPDNQATVSRICQRLDGIPLAIELAAARVGVLSVEQVLCRLDDRFQLLTRRNPAAPRRQQTLLETIDWSYVLCSAAEQTLWAHLSVFTDSFDIEAAEVVCTCEGIADGDIVQLLAGLVDKSILLRVDCGSFVVYEMLETIREYGRRWLSLCGKSSTMRHRHADYYLRLAARADDQWHTEQQTAWSDRLRHAHANLRVSLDFLLTEPGEAQAGLGMLVNLWNYWCACGLVKEASHWFEQALRIAVEPTPMRAEALSIAAFAAFHKGDHAAAFAFLAEGYEIAEKFDDESALASAGRTAAWIEIARGNYTCGITRYEEALARLRSLCDRSGIATVLWETAFSYCMRADGDRDDIDRAIALCQECIRMSELCGESWCRSFALYVYGLGLWNRKKYREAEELTRKSIQLKLLINDLMGIALCLETLAWIATVDGGYERAARIFGATAAVRRKAGIQLSKVTRLLYYCENSREQVRRALGSAAYKDAFQKGTELTVEEAVEFVLDSDSSTTPPGRTGHDEKAVLLTQRERQVAELVTQGLSNKQIAARLVIAQRTAEGHVQRILTKLNFSSRTQLVAWVLGEER